MRRAALLLGGLAALLVPATASAADSVYWGNFESIRTGNLDGAGSASTLFGGQSLPSGVAIDPAANRIYWADWGHGAIRVGNLDGSGSPSSLFAGENEPSGVAIDPAANKIYWSNSATSGAIRTGSLDGSGSPSSLFTGETNPVAVAIDAAANKIYWASFGTDAIRVGNLDGTGSASDLFTAQAPLGVAIDPAANKIYWATENGAIRVGNLDGTDVPSSLFTGEEVPDGVAIDPAENKIYWANDGSNAIRVGNLDGTDSASDLFTTESPSRFPALLRSPAGTGLPAISGGDQVGDRLSCGEGSWATDLLGGFLYRAPSGFAYQWRLNGNDISGADQDAYTPTESGSYTCRVTASNHAGSAAQTSDPHQILVPSRPACEDISPSIPHDRPAEIGLECSGQGTLTYEVVMQPADGEISNFDNSAGTLTYTPDQGFTGTDSFTYRASNAGGNSNTATATITVLPPPPPPPPSNESASPS